MPKAQSALAKSAEWGDKIPIGVFYRSELVSTYEDRISRRIPDYRENPPGKQKIAGVNGELLGDISALLGQFRVA